MGTGQGPEESAPAFNMEHRRLNPLRRRIDDCSRRRIYTSAILPFDSGDNRRSSTHYTRHLPFRSASHLFWGPHRYYGRAGLRPKLVWLLGPVTFDPDLPQPNQDGGKNAYRGIRKCLSDL